MATPGLSELLANPQGMRPQNVGINPIAVNPGQMQQFNPAQLPQQQANTQGFGQLAGVLGDMGKETGPTLDSAGILDTVPTTGAPVGIAKPEDIASAQNMLGHNLPIGTMAPGGAYEQMQTNPGQPAVQAPPQLPLQGAAPMPGNPGVGVGNALSAGSQSGGGISSLLGGMFG